MSIKRYPRTDDKSYVYQPEADDKAELIKMVVHGRSIEYYSLMRYVDTFSFRKLYKSLGYVTNKRSGPVLKEDYTVTYHRSVYAGKPCVFFVKDKKEYVFYKPTKE